MIIRIVTFTPEGEKLGRKIAENLSRDIIEFNNKNVNLDEWVKESFEFHLPIVFIGAMGIAVRKISPYVKDKLTDSPVIVIDEKGRNIIPVLSGHIGGANSIAKYIHEKIGGNLVITTATDVEGVFSVDLFAKENGFKIINREKIAVISKAVLQGKKLECSVIDKEMIFYEDAGIENGIKLRFMPYVLGIGCKKDTPFIKIQSAVARVLSEINIPLETIADYVFTIATIDLKEKEYGLNLFAQSNGILLKTYTAEELNEVPGDFTESEFVSRITGTDNVCERSAMKAAGIGAELIMKKVSCDGVTVAVARREFDKKSFLTKVY